MNVTVINGASVWLRRNGEEVFNARAQLRDRHAPCSASIYIDVKLAA
jgi:hypothetical protein